MNTYNNTLTYSLKYDQSFVDFDHSDSDYNYLKRFRKKKGQNFYLPC